MLLSNEHSTFQNLCLFNDNTSIVQHPQKYSNGICVSTDKLMKRRVKKPLQFECFCLIAYLGASNIPNLIWFAIVKINMPPVRLVNFLLILLQFSGSSSWVPTQKHTIATQPTKQQLCQTQKYKILDS